ncbi:unnamed protein product [Soboliphyme baturini]|uniref:t-SNARE coiled-coil homology domain-containing protein n=1 Tax=Soboliphyme baturini TaxID=241478 RepID=A0A183IIS9_9BILA|nr:unnamed protein product [Soboliphyme baturini]
MDELTNYIKQDIASLNKQLSILQEMLQRRKDSVGTNRSQHSQSVVVTLQSKLATMSTEFKNVLELRTENMKQEKVRREKFSSNQSIPSTLPPSASHGDMGSLLLHDSASDAPRSHSFVMNMDDVGKRHVQQQLQLIDEQDSYVRSRVETMANIESTIVDLGQIFQQLSHMVQEQGEVVQRIDSNVEEASLSVEAAHMELLKYFRGISKNRWLAIKVFGVLVIFFIFFVVFFL